MPVPADQLPLLGTLRRTVYHLKRIGVPFCLAGSFAVYARGGAAFDHDIDFLIREQDTSTVLTALTEVGYTAEVPPEGWLVKAYDDGRMIDFVYCPVQRPVTDATFADTDVLTVGACHMPVLSATELMIHKVLTWSEHYCDFAKGLPPARSLREQIDWHRVYRETAWSPYAYAFLTLLDRLGVTQPTAAGPHKPATVGGDPTAIGRDATAIGRDATAIGRGPTAVGGGIVAESQQSTMIRAGGDPH